MKCGLSLVFKTVRFVMGLTCGDLSATGKAVKRPERAESFLYGAVHLATATFVQWLCMRQIGHGRKLKL